MSVGQYSISVFMQYWFEGFQDGIYTLTHFRLAKQVGTDQGKLPRHQRV